MFIWCWSSHWAITGCLVSILIKYPMVKLSYPDWMAQLSLHLRPRFLFRALQVGQNIYFNCSLVVFLYLFNSISWPRMNGQHLKDLLPYSLSYGGIFSSSSYLWVAEAILYYQLHFVVVVVTVSHMILPAKIDCKLPEGREELCAEDSPAINS